MQGQSAESVLDRYAGPGGARGGSVQRLDTSFGKFDTTKYDKVGPAGSERGVEINLTFDPDVTKVDAMKIGLTQSVRSQRTGSSVALYHANKERQVPTGQTGAGTEIDRFGGGAYGNPLYAADSPTGKEKNLGETPTVAGWGQHGWAYKDAKGAQKHQIAKLNDTPTLRNPGKDSGQDFETVALAVGGKQAGTYMGSVSWGWSTDGAGKFTQKPLTLVSKGDPSKTFIAAAKQWNSIANFGNIKAEASPTNVYDDAMSVAFTVAKGTDLHLKAGGYYINGAYYGQMDVTSGKEKGKSGYVKVNDMKDVGGANPVERGRVKWELGRPYFARKDERCACVHLDKKKGCTVYDDRPRVCRTYSCVSDERIWKDFEKMIPNTEWIEQNLRPAHRRLLSVRMERFS